MWKLIFVVLIVGVVWAQKDGFNYTPDDGYEIVGTTTGASIGAIEACGEGEQEGVKKCVPYHRCDGRTNTIIGEEVDETKVNTNGFGLIDIRFGANECKDGLDVCCTIGVPKPTPNPVVDPTSTESPPEPSSVSPTPSRPSKSNACGIRNIKGVDFTIKINTDNSSEYGEFPWMMAVLRRHFNPALNETLAICGGSLLAPDVVLTGAHCVQKYKTEDLKVRAGEWDTQTEKERLPYQERNVKQIIVHEKFHPNVLYNDVALLILETRVEKAEHIGTICLPEQDEVIVSEHCIATGWGKDVFGKEGRVQSILKKIELPIVAHDECEKELRSSRLGAKFRLDKSFTCAGGKNGKDTCTGDGGSPLVCPDPHNPKRYVQAGIVAWGIGCSENYPGVYADVAKFRDWIQQNLERLNINKKFYTV